MTTITIENLTRNLALMIPTGIADGPVFTDDRYGVIEVITLNYPERITDGKSLADWLLEQNPTAEKMWLYQLDTEKQQVRFGTAADNRSVNRAFRTELDVDFTDISSEAARTYNFGTKGFVRIDNPLKLAVSASGGHRIFSHDGRSHYIPSGWIQLTWTARTGQPNFVA